MIAETSYTDEFYTVIGRWSEQSSQQIVPSVIDLVRPTSVIDIGCGDGTWLRTFMENGICDVIGIDGDYVSRQSLKIPVDRFVAWDLSQATLPPLPLSRFDLVVSLEVGEHLPDKSATSFVANLIRLGSVVLFSAAIPHQGGTQHLNEQWPDYWAALFAQHGYIAVDCLRERFWDNEAISWFYRQNALLYVNMSDDHLSTGLKGMLTPQLATPHRLVHPILFEQRQEVLENTKAQLDKPTLGYLLSALPGAIKRSFLKRSSLGTKTRNPMP